MRHLPGVCNLYRLRAAKAEIADIFRVAVPEGANYGEEVYPAYAGLMVAGDQARVMTWGFPRIMTGRQGRKLRPRPVTNARSENLGSPFWRESFAQRRCLIPLSQWAEPEGESGRMTRSWYALPGSELFAVAGLWSPSDIWGACYTMVMVPSFQQMAQAHDRMPVILPREDWERWTGSKPREALSLCRTWTEELVYEPTADPFVPATANTAARKTSIPPTPPKRDDRQLPLL